MKTGVIAKLNGDLLRWGEDVDWENDGNFNSLLESVRDDLPENPIRKGQLGEDEHHRWNGSSWVLVDPLL